MPEIFSIQGDDLDLGYINIRDADDGPEAEMHGLIQKLWEAYHPYADSDFCSGLAQDVDGRFWEMLLGYTLLDAGHSLLPRSERPARGGQPDLCVIEGKKRIWIEAIAPTRGETGPYQVPELVAGVVTNVPVQETRLRLTSAFWTKYTKYTNYIAEGVVAPEDSLVIAISGSRFALQILDEPPLPLTSLFPVGNEMVTLNRATGEVVGHGFQYQPAIDREGDAIPKTAFTQRDFEVISGVLWSRIGLGNLSRDVRPLTMVHNPFATSPISHGWGPWDREYVAREAENEWIVDNIRAQR